MKIHIDGRLYEKEDAKVSVFDHGLLYGDGVFEGIRAYNGRVFCLREHLARLFNSAKGIHLEIPQSKAEIESALLDTVRANRLKDAYIRLVVTRGTGDLGLDPRKCKRATVIIIADKIALYPEKVYEKGLTLITSSLRRMSPDQLSPSIKSLNYLNNILARAEATRAGADEAILLNQQGYVAECSGDNIFFLRDNKAYTPPVSSGILEGVTRNVVMKLIREQLGIEVREELFTCFELYRAEEAFVTGTGAEVIGVTKIDGREIGHGAAGPLTKRIIELFRKYASQNGTPIYKGAGAAR
ncbi:MAG: branched-chain-amino-acid transaminase [Elusimicrobia bacterium]|nr:branched-chain-amino-acid transaminase [Elusimicrobiota bacterium]